MIDEKAIYQIREGKVGFKVYNAANSLMTYQDGHKICFSDLTKNPYDGDLYLGIKPDKMQLLIQPQGILTGAEVLALHGSSNYKVRQPI